LKTKQTLTSTDILSAPRLLSSVQADEVAKMIDWSRLLSEFDWRFLPVWIIWGIFAVVLVVCIEQSLRHLLLV
jgi:hypothetical protein